MPYYSQQQHTSLHASTVQRKHLNLLLFDQSDEVKRIYDGTGRLPTHTLSPQRLRESIVSVLCWSIKNGFYHII